MFPCLRCSPEAWNVLISEETVTQHLQKALSLVKGGKIFKVSLIHFDKSSIWRRIVKQYSEAGMGGTNGHRVVYRRQESKDVSLSEGQLVRAGD